MKRNLVLVAGIGAVIIVGIVVFFLVSGSNGGSGSVKDVEKMFEAHMDAIKGDGSELEGLKVEKDYVAETDKILNSLVSGNEAQVKAAKKAVEKTEYSIVAVKEDGEDNFRVIYKVDTYPVVDSLNKYISNPQDYLSDEELEVFKSHDSTNPEYKNVTQKLFDAYLSGFDSEEPIEETHEVFYVNGDDGIEFENEAQFETIIRSILGMRSSNQVTTD